MNTTDASDNASITIITLSWFIPFDITIIICTILVIILAILYLFIIIVDKTCHTVPMMLIANSCLSEFLASCDLLGMTVFTLQNDLQQIQYQDSFCIFRCYFGYVACALQNYSYLLLSIYRYLLIVYPTRLVWHSVRIQLCFISVVWIFAFICSIPFLFTNEIIYNLDNQICQIPLGLSFSVIFVSTCIYTVPIWLVILIYLKLVQYVKEMNQRVTPANTLLRIKREFKMVRRIVILVIGVTTIGFPYLLCILLSLFNRAPIYHFRIIYLFIGISLVFVMIALFQITDPLKVSIMKRIKRRSNMIVARVL